MDLAARIDALTQPEPMTGCLLWLGTTSRGYAKIDVHSKTQRANRVVWELHRGPIPKGMHVLHKCDTPCCLNIEHLFLGTHDDNMRDKVEKGRVGHRPLATHCPHGHPYDEKNTRTKPDGRRECRTCHNARERRARRWSA